MSKNTNAVIPSQDHVLKTGDALETMGSLIAILGAAVGLIVLFTGGNGLAFGLVPIGLLLLIAGYTKKAAAVNTAMFILKMREFETNHVSQGEHQA